jgi:septation ring formation regulator EzrA
MTVQDAQRQLADFDRQITRAEADVEANNATVKRLIPQQEECEKQSIAEFGVTIAELPAKIAQMEEELEQGLVYFADQLAKAQPQQ